MDSLDMKIEQLRKNKQEIDELIQDLLELRELKENIEDDRK